VRTEREQLRQVDARVHAVVVLWVGEDVGGNVHIHPLHLGESVRSMRPGRCLRRREQPPRGRPEALKRNVQVEPRASGSVVKARDLIKRRREREQPVQARKARVARLEPPQGVKRIQRHHTPQRVRHNHHALGVVIGEGHLQLPRERRVNGDAGGMPRRRRVLT